MNVPTKLGLYTLALAAAFGAALGAGRLVGPLDDDAEASTTESADGGAAAGSGGHGGHGGSETTEVREDDRADQAEQIPGGLLVSERGYTLALNSDVLSAGPAAALSFEVVGPDGTAVTEYDESHDKELHLIAVRRDFTGYQHVHPVRDSAGTWSVPLALTSGEWRVFADFTVSGESEGLILGADLTVPGDYQAVALPPSSDTAEVDGYTVGLDGELRPGEESTLTLSVSRDGAPVTDLEPYLDAYGHLVVLRDGDLAYLHVHPEGQPGDGVTQPGPDVGFSVEVPSAGTYRLFLDFQHDGEVRTAQFTVRAGAGGHH